MYFFLLQTLFLLPAGIPLTGKTPHSLPGDPSPPVTQGHQGAAPRHAFSVDTARKHVCYFTMNMCNGSCVRLYLRPRLFLHIGKYALKLVPTIPMRRHRVLLLSVGTLLILFCSSEWPAFHRPGRLTYWTSPHSWQVASLPLHACYHLRPLALLGFPHSLPGRPQTPTQAAAWCSSI